MRYGSATNPSLCHRRLERQVFMSLKGTTALVGLAQNPRCEVLGAMVLQEGPETRFFERVVGTPYDREFGERQSSKRRGAQFERNAYAGVELERRGAAVGVLAQKLRSAARTLRDVELAIRVRAGELR